MTALPFGRQIGLNYRGPDCLAVKRALARAGFGPKKLAGLTRVFGPYAVKELERFQADQGIAADGVYGALTHSRLSPFFDSRAWHLYAEVHPAGQIQLPAVFTSTHETSGLDGYPAVDVFAPGGTIALAPAAGEIHKLSGHEPTASTTPGGPYGWSIYLRDASGNDYFLTHFGTRSVTVGTHVNRGDVIGTVCDAKVAHMSSSLSHIHEGKRSS